MAESYVRFWFMFPVGIVIATCALTAGIGGAVLFGPLFLIVFPWLGPKYTFNSPSVSVGVAILIETFGFSSGLIGYSRRGLINWRLALHLSCFSIPTAVMASFIVHPSSLILKVLYALLVFAVSAYMITSADVRLILFDLFRPKFGVTMVKGEEDEEESTGATTNPISCEIDSTTMITEPAPLPQKGQPPDNILTHHPLPLTPSMMLILATGGLLTGFLGVGAGELTLPMLIHHGLPTSLAAATSTAVVTLTCMSTAIVQVTRFVVYGGWDAIPWNLVIYAIPGVVIGAQIAAANQGSLSSGCFKLFIGIFFVCIGLVFSSLLIANSSE